MGIHPLADSTALGTGEPMRVAILYNGAPPATVLVTLLRENGTHDGRKQVAELRSDAADTATVTPPDAGRHLMFVRHRTATSDGPDAQSSVTATLMFEVGEQDAGGRGREHSPAWGFVRWWKRTHRTRRARAGAFPSTSRCWRASYWASSAG